jgi:ribosomal protein S18 acetylase RimI-like enzyme
MIEYRRMAEGELAGILALCAAEPWPTYTEDTARTWRALTAPGVVTVVAVEDRQVLGFIQMLSDGHIEAFISLLLVDHERRGQGIGRRLVETAFRHSGAQRVDLVTDSAPEFYRAFAHHEFAGFRLYPQRNKDGTPRESS